MNNPMLTLPQARDLLAEAFAQSRRDGLRPMAIAVLDAAAQPLLLAREELAPALRLDIAWGKAAAAVGMGTNTRALVQRAAANPPFFAAIAALPGLRFVPQTGGVLVRDAAGSVLGAIGASGASGDEDEAVCLAAIQAVGLCAG